MEKYRNLLPCFVVLCALCASVVKNNLNGYSA